MSSAPTVKLSAVAQDIFIASPPTSSVVKDAPKLVVLFGWMGAQFSHLHKYIALHHEQYPSTPVLLIQSHPRQWFQPQSYRLPSLRPVLSILPSSDILFHVISNGGCYRLADLLTLRPITADSRSRILFDSGPGALELEPSLMAFLAPFKNPFARFMGRVILTPFFLLVAIPDRLFRTPDLLERMRRPLNDSTKIALDVPRAYIYSKEDLLVQDWAVEAHGKNAQEKGYEVTFHRFHGSKHVEHLRQAPDKYKEVIWALWLAK